MKKLFIAFLFLFAALAYGIVSGAGPLCGSAYAADNTPDGSGDPDGGGSDDSGNGGPDDTSDDGGCGGGGSGDSGGGSDPDGSGGGADF